MTYAHLCSDGVIYVWEPNKPNPKACPRCKSRTDSPYIQSVKVGELSFFFNKTNLEKYKAPSISISGTIENSDAIKELISEALKQSRKSR